MNNPALSARNENAPLAGKPFGTGIERGMGARSSPMPLSTGPGLRRGDVIQGIRVSGVNTLSNHPSELRLIFEYAHFLKYFGSSTNEPVMPKRSFRVVHHCCG